MAVNCYDNGVCRARTPSIFRVLRHLQMRSCACAREFVLNIAEARTCLMPRWVPRTCETKNLLGAILHSRACLR